MEPEWAENFPPDNKIKLLCLKFGVPENVDLAIDEYDKKIMFGRLPECDVYINDISVSRNHCIIYYGKQVEDKLSSFWLYDTGSQNGTFINGKTCNARKFTQLRNGDALKFGSHNNQYVFEYEYDIRGVDIAESESKQVQRVKVAPTIHASVENEQAKTNEAASAVPAVNDPIKIIKNYFEKECYEFDLKTSKSTHDFGVYFETRLRVPIEDTANGETTEVVFSAEEEDRKSSITKCCQKAFEHLYKLGILTEHSIETIAAKRKRELIENDYYESDDDTFYDRTGDVEKKRLKRMKLMNNEDQHEKKNQRSCLNLDMYNTSAKINSRIQQLDRDAIRLKMHIKRMKTKIQNNKNDDIDDFDQDAVAMRKATNKDLNLELTSYENKLQMSTREKKLLNEKLKSVIVNEKNNSKQKTSKNEIIKNDKNSKVIQSMLKNYGIQYDNTDVKKKVSETESRNQSSSNEFNESNNHNNMNVIKPSFMEDNAGLASEASNRDIKGTKQEEMCDDTSICWVPPTDQKGDGKSKLNEKYGY